MDFRKLHLTFDSRLAKVVTKLKWIKQKCAKTFHFFYDSRVFTRERERERTTAGGEEREKKRERKNDRARDGDKARK